MRENERLAPAPSAVCPHQFQMLTMMTLALVGQEFQHQNQRVKENYVDKWLTATLSEVVRGRTAVLKAPFLIILGKLKVC